MKERIVELLLTFFVLLTVVPAILVVLTQHIVRAACWLLVSLSGAAGLFFLLGADFVGGTQLLIYVGGTLVLVIFGVMLTATGPFVNLRTRGGDWALAIFAGAALFVVLVLGVTRPIFDDPSRFPPPEEGRASVTTNRIGLAFLGLAGGDDAAEPPIPAASNFLLPFEIVSVHLVVVLIGAAYLARARRRKWEEA